MEWSNKNLLCLRQETKSGFERGEFIHSHDRERERAAAVPMPYACRKSVRRCFLEFRKGVYVYIVRNISWYHFIIIHCVAHDGKLKFTENLVND